MNVKYYPKLKEFALHAQQILDSSPEVVAKNKKAKKPIDLLVSVHHAMMDLGDFDQDYSLEVSKVIFYGYYKEINEYYQVEKVVLL